MSTEENKEIVRRYIEEAVGQGQLDRTGEFVADSYVRHDPSQPAEVRGLAALTALNARLRAPFPDLQLTIEDLLAEGDKVVTRVIARGTHRGEFLGLAPTGRPAVATAIVIHRLAGGKIVEEWVQVDTLGMLQQLGALPGPGFHAQDGA